MPLRGRERLKWRTSWTPPAFAGPAIPTSPIVPRKKTHRLNDYTGNPFLFFHCFGTYIWICGQFFYKQHPDVPLAQSRHTSATTSGTSHKFSLGRHVCGMLPMERLNSMRVSTVHDTATWQSHPTDWTDLYFSPTCPRGYHGLKKAFLHRVFVLCCVQR